MPSLKAAGARAFASLRQAGSGDLVACCKRRHLPGDGSFNMRTASMARPMPTSRIDRSSGVGAGVGYRTTASVGPRMGVPVTRCLSVDMTNGWTIRDSFSAFQHRRSSSSSSSSTTSSSSPAPTLTNDDESKDPASNTSSDDASTADSFTDVPGSKAGGKKLAIVFTCNVCDTRSAKQFTEHAYTNGVVIVQCPKCNSRHLIADNLGMFTDDEEWTIEGAMDKMGQSVTRVTDDNVMELTLEDVVGEIPRSPTKT
eukprot:CAMPEP_0198126906 /NCGR_PEP_ID=MMETSP1442-20131203/46053_1 /TAXON_ID= /ORGANISM="Craspedostauros australis, Strain CCMP3328" /LENGTH=254 /DNA_ID=CAMNT_0043786801 /DNA_START=92 /DNA_END=856 /DNA_ORIENTATION=+